jgi:hypothetical protein
MTSEEERARAQLAEWTRGQRRERQPIDWQSAEPSRALPRVSLMEWVRRESELTGVPLIMLLQIMLDALKGDGDNETLR